MHNKISIIRGVMPSMISIDDLVGIQPLNSPTGQRFSIKYDWMTNIRHVYEEITDGRTEYIVSCPYYIIDEMYEWCVKTFGPSFGPTIIDTQRWMQYGLLFKFRNEDDRTWFILRWSE